MSEVVISARHLGKRYGRTRALEDIGFEVRAGQIVGLIGRNGAGKTTLLKALLGLTRYTGDLQVVGKRPFRERGRLVDDVSYIADVATLPRWMTVRQLLSFVSACHPKFDVSRANALLEGSQIKTEAKIKTLSKGLVTQLHLALVMAIDARLLVLDEPTLGLDIVYRKHFYASLLEQYFDHSRTILLTTHQVEEIEHILTDVIFIDRGRLLLAQSVERLGEHFCEVLVRREQLAEARALAPISERESFGQSVCLYRDVDRSALLSLGELRTPALADLFVALVTGGRQ